MQQLKQLLNKRNWWLVVLLAAEILFVLFRFAANFTSGQAITITPDLIVPYVDECTNDARGARVENFTGTFATTRWMDIKPGSYQVAITYVTNGWDGEATFLNEIMPWASYDKITLPAGRTRTVFSLWMPTGCETAQLQFSANCGEQRVMYITGAELTPTHSYAYVNFILAVLFFAIADYLLLLALHKLPFPVRSVKARYGIAFMVGVVLLACLPLGMNYLPYGHDLSAHLSRIEGLKSGLLAGQFPVRIDPALVNEKGYPFSLMYADLLLYPCAILRIIGFSLDTVYKLYVVCITAATALVMRYVLRKMTGSERVALLGAALYTLSLYRLTNVYVRAALGEYSAMLFLPVVVYGLWRIYDQGPQGGRKPAAFCWLPLAIGFTGLLQTHLLTTLMALLFTIVFCLILCKKTFTVPVFTALLKAAGAAVLWNLWFVVPLLQYMTGGVCAVANAYSGAYMGDSAVFLSQIFMPFGHTGFANSITLGIQDEMSFTVGLPLTLCAGLFVMALLDPDVKRGNRPLLRVGALVFGFAVLGIWMASDMFPWYPLNEYCKPLSDLLGKLQFTWRFLSLASALLVICGGIALVLYVRSKPKIATAAAAAMLLLAVLPAGDLMQQAMQNSAVVHYRSLASLDTIYLQVSGGEYLPADLAEDTGAAWAETGPVCSAGVEQTAYTKQNLTVQLSAANTADSEGTITLPLFSYPGYRLTGDAGATLGSEGGYLTVQLPAGWSGSVRVWFAGFWYWRVADGISLIAVALSIFFYRKRRDKALKVKIKAA